MDKIELKYISLHWANHPVDRVHWIHLVEPFLQQAQGRELHFHRMLEKEWHGGSKSSVWRLDGPEMIPDIGTRTLHKSPAWVCQPSRTRQRNSGTETFPEWALGSFPRINSRVSRGKTDVCEASSHQVLLIFPPTCGFSRAGVLSPKTCVLCFLSWALGKKEGACDVVLAGTVRMDECLGSRSADGSLTSWRVYFLSCGYVV